MRNTIILFLLISGVAYCSYDESNVVLAVVPFRNVMGKQELDWMCEGFAETMATKLNHVPGCRLVERVQISEVMKELQLGLTDLTEDRAGSVGKLLNADYLVVGSFQKLDMPGATTLKINTRMVHVESGELDPGKATGASGPYEDVFRIQDEIATGLAHKLGLPLDEESTRELRRDETSSVAAYELYNLARHETDGARKTDILRRALELDPDYAKAHVLLGSVLAPMAFTDPALRSTAIHHAHEALRLDESLVDAHYLLGDLYHHQSRDGDLSKSERNNSKERATTHLEIFIEEKGDSPASYYQRKVDRARSWLKRLR